MHLLVQLIQRKQKLSPFLFNVFSIDPPILVFSPNRTRDNTSKDTLENVKDINECVISLVTEEIAQQVSLALCEFDSNVNEFEKAGLTEVKLNVFYHQELWNPQLTLSVR